MILGLTGRARSGKSDTASAISKRATELKLKPTLYDIGNLVREFCINHKLIPDKPRQYLNKEELSTLVRIGAEQREKDPNFWLQQLQDELPEPHNSVIIMPNVRYQNEADFVKRNGGYTIKIVALNPNGSEFISPDREPNHPSETELQHLNANYFITTRRGEAPLLKAQARTLFDHILSTQPKPTDDRQIEMFEGVIA
jgi:hypothetical protein